jgi:hypothetical protein
VALNSRYANRLGMARPPLSDLVSKESLSPHLVSKAHTNVTRSSPGWTAAACPSPASSVPTAGLLLTREMFVASAGPSPTVSADQADSDGVLTVCRRKTTNTGALAKKPRITVTGVTTLRLSTLFRRGSTRSIFFPLDFPLIQLNWMYLLFFLA